MLRHHSLLNPLCAGALTVFLSTSVSATQLNFQRTESEQHLAFSYHWLDADEQQHRMQIAFDLSELARRERALINFRPDIAQRHIYVELMKIIQTVDPREARFEIRQTPHRLAFSVKARSPTKQRQWLQALRAKETQVFSQYLTNNHYHTYTDAVGFRRIKPDYQHFIADQTAIMLPISRALYEVINQNQSNREFADILLSWLQSIPYHALDDRSTFNGSGYLPPTEVINNNTGDCDSKTVLAATILRAMYPRLSMAIIYLPGHALLGATIPHTEQESHIRIDDHDYLLLEPTGPALLKAGEIGADTQFHIDSGMYTYEKVL